MADPLRDRQSLRVLAEKRQVIEIAEEISSFSRLAESVVEDFAAQDGSEPPRGWRQSPVGGRLQFGPAGDGEAAASGELDADVPAVCQRCLAPFVLRLETPVEIVFRRETPRATSPEDGAEVWEVADGNVRPIDVIDELLVMALPLSPRHEAEAHCRWVGEARDETETTRPFANLRAQMDEADRN